MECSGGVDTVSPAPLRIRALQAAMLRLTIDPDFGAALYRGDWSARDRRARGPYTLTDADLSLFQAVDARAWTTDEYRRTRLVQAVIEEYAVTTAIVGVPVVHRFFGTPQFAAVLGHRGRPLKPSERGPSHSAPHQTARWCSSRPPSRVPAAASAPRCGHRDRARQRGRPGSDRYVGSLQQGLATLGGNPVQAAADGVLVGPRCSTRPGALLVERNDAAVACILRRPPSRLTTFCRTPRPHAAVTREARKLKVGKKYIRQVLRTMQSEGLLELRRS